MNNFVIDTPDNFWQIRWLDKYMEGHKGFIAGGCFKNILSGERVKDKISLMTEEEQQKEVAVWGENMNLMKDCSLEKTDEDLYYNTEWDYTCEESELEPEDKNDPDVHKVYEAGMHYIYSN